MFNELYFFFLDHFVFEFFPRQNLQGTALSKVHLDLLVVDLPWPWEDDVSFSTQLFTSHPTSLLH